MDQPVEERAGGDHRAGAGERAAVGEDDAGDATAVHQQVGRLALQNVEAVHRVQRPLHGAAVERAVRLGARPAHGGALGPVEDAELDAGGVGDAAHQAVERVDLAHEVTFAEAADRRVAGQRADRLAPLRHQRGARAAARGGGGGLAAGMAATDHDDIVGERLHGTIRLLDRC